jgi:hypothetical protein
MSVQCCADYAQQHGLTMTRAKKLFGIFGTIGFGIFMAVIVLEIIGRVLHLVSVTLPESYQEVRQIVGRFPEPYSYFWFNREDGERIWVQFNYRSLRDIDHDYEKATDTTRIMFLGDSYTAGWQVTLEQTYTGHLRDWLRDSGNFDFINAGLHGWGTDRQYLYYHTDGYRYDNDVVVLQFYVGNDILDNGIGVLQPRELPDGRRIVTHNITEDRPYFLMDDNGALQYTPPAWLPPTHEEQVGGVRSFLRHYTFTYALLEQLLKLVQGSDENAPENDAFVLPFDRRFPVDYYAFAPETESLDDWQQAWSITTALIQQLRSEVEATGATFMVLLVDARWQHDPQGFEQLRETWDIPADWQTARWSNRVRTFLDAENIPYLAPLDALLTYQAATSEPIIFSKDGHWTAQGQCVVAVELHNWLIERGIIHNNVTQRDSLLECLDRTGN